MSKEPSEKLLQYLHNKKLLNGLDKLIATGEYCFKTLNRDIELFKATGFSDLKQASEELIVKLEIEDLIKFVKELEGE